MYLATTSKTSGQNIGSGVTFPSIFRWLNGPIGPKDHVPSRLNFHFHLPSHFTIPILSPWTSVVWQSFRDLPNLLTLVFQVENQTSSKSASSANIYLVSLFLVTTISIVIIWRNSRDGRVFPDKVNQGSGNAPRFATCIQQLYGLILGGIPFFNLGRWAWGWANKVLLLLGIAPG